MIESTTATPELTDIMDSITARIDALDEDDDMVEIHALVYALGALTGFVDWKVGKQVHGVVIAKQQ